MAVDGIEVDVLGEVVAVPRDAVSSLAAAAAARAGISSRHRELSLALNRALQAGRGSLGRDELRALRAVLEEERDGFDEAVAVILRAAAKVS